MIHFLHTVRKLLGLSGHRPPARLPLPHRVRPSLESLEARVTPSATGTLRLEPEAVQAVSVVAGDFTGDGRQDVARLTATGVWQVGTSGGTYFGLNLWDRWDARTAWKSIQVGDFNGDGKDDLAGMNHLGVWYVGLSTGTRFHTFAWGSWNWTGQWTKVLTGDFNGDGKTDLAGFNIGGFWSVGVSTGAGFRSTPWSVWSVPGRWASVHVGDVNGDRKDDVIGMDLTGGLAVGLSTGDRFQLLRWGQWDSSLYFANVQVGDFNGDRKADLAGLTWGGYWNVGLSTGSGFTNQQWARWAPADRFVDVQVTDFNKDGRDDFVGLARNGQIIGSPSEGYRAGTTTMARWTFPMAGFGLQVGDFDGDGTGDVAGFGRDGRWVVGRSTGRFFYTREYARWPVGLDQPGYGGEAVPYAPGAPWGSAAGKRWLDILPSNTLQAMYYNNPDAYITYVEYFYGVLRAWTDEADRAGVRTEAAIRKFMAARLDAYFPVVKPVLARAYRGLTTEQYRALMTMNLVHGFYEYASTQNRIGLLYRLLHARTGDCSEISDLTIQLGRIQGLTINMLGIVSDFPTPDGQFLSVHVVAISNGLILDSQTNVAFRVNLRTLTRIAPESRLQYLFNTQSVYGFYNWYLKPDVRAAQLAKQFDGGVVAFYYKYYFQGIANGRSYYRIS